MRQRTATRGPPARPSRVMFERSWMLFFLGWKVWKWHHKCWIMMQCVTMKYPRDTCSRFCQLDRYKHDDERLNVISSYHSFFYQLIDAFMIMTSLCKWNRIDAFWIQVTQSNLQKIVTSRDITLTIMPFFHLLWRAPFFLILRCRNNSYLTNFRSLFVYRP